MEKIKTMKIKIPKKHFLFYRKLYQYLNETLLLNDEGVYSKTFSDKLIVGYLKSSSGKKNGFKNKIFDEEQVSLKTVQKSKSDLEKRHEEIYKCTKCFLGKKERVFIPIQEKSSIMILNDIPSFYDQMQGKYFQGEEGSVFKKILKALNVDIKKTYFTSAIKCASVLEINNQLDKVSACLEHLTSELNIVQPKLILAFGCNTYEFLFKKNNFIEIHGKKLRFQGVDIIFTYHPRDLLIDEKLKKDCWEDLKKHLDEIKLLL